MNRQDQACLAALTTLVVLLLVPIGALLKAEVAAQRAQKQKIVAEFQWRETAITRKKEAVFAGLKCNLPQDKSGPKTIAKIAQGTEGQADFIGHTYSNGIEGLFVGPNVEQYPDGWNITPVKTGHSERVGVSPGEWYYGIPGWDLDMSGTVVVPAHAPPGVYKAEYQEIDYSQSDASFYPRTTYRYEFEVVPRKRNLRAHKKVRFS